MYSKIVAAAVSMVCRIMQLLNTPVFLVVLILLPSVIPGTGVMTLEPLKSPGLTQAQFSLPEVRDAKERVLLSPGAAWAGVAAALCLMH